MNRFKDRYDQYLCFSLWWFSDTLIEQEVNGTPVSDIFQLYGEGFFRDKEVCRIYDDTNSPTMIKPTKE